MSKKVTLIPKVDKEKAEEERKKQREAKIEYLGNVAEKVFDAIEKIFDETKPVPTGGDMISVLALVPVFVFARQIRMACKSKKAMQSVMKSTILALIRQMETYANPLMNGPSAWDEIAGEKGGSNGGTESKEL